MIVAKPDLEVIKHFSCPVQQRTKIILLIVVKMPTIVGIKTLISKINTISERLKAKTVFICPHFSYYEQLKISCSVELSMKKVL